MTPNVHKVARLVDDQLPYGWAFVLLLYRTGTPGTFSYVTSGQRHEVLILIRHFSELTRAKWAEHVQDIGPANDEEIARLRQRVAELERLCSSAADALEGKSAPYLDHRAFAIQSTELIAELREAGK
jgi:hypothetical protein